MAHDKGAQVLVLQREREAEAAFRKFMQTILDPGRKKYPQEPKLKD